MQDYLKYLALSALLILCPFFSQAQTSSSLWQQSELERLKTSDADLPWIQASKADYYQLNFQSLYSDILQNRGGFELFLPNAKGSLEPFYLVENTIMPEAMKTEFPEIAAFDLRSTESPAIYGKLDISPDGLRALIVVPGEGSYYIDPVFQGDNTAYIAYSKTAFITDKTANCLVAPEPGKYSAGDPKSGLDYNDCELKTYRLAVAATGEYTIFHGGTVANAMAAIVTSVNRVNSVYERDFGVTFELIPNNSNIVYTNPSNDPYSNGNPGAMITQNQNNINSVIGSANYDVGHVFGTNSGGLAGLGVTCSNNSKARGVTGSSAPVGDPFDIDYVAHEVGHQFGARHTFNNSCSGNRSDATAVEPGSGSTIMAYAGICNPNVQNNSDDHFHGISMSEIGNQIQADNCPVVTAITNMAPVIDSVTTNFFIPALTPFALTAYAQDMDEEDVLTYCWEQMDNEISSQPPLATSTSGPNFRSFSPIPTPTRYFPRLEELVNSSSSTWQRLSSVDRDMSFRVSVRDNAPGAGCTQYEDAEITVYADAGPFLVTYPTAVAIVWEAFTQETVTWDVAGTDADPINAEFVDILLSVDGGLSYPISLADNTPNDGSQLIDVPNNITDDARIMIITSAGTFFDISNNDFTINGVVNGFNLSSANPEQSACTGQNLEFTFTADAIGNFTDLINLSIVNDPTEVDVELSQNTMNAGETVTLTVSNTADFEGGVLEIIVLGESGGFESAVSFLAGFNAVDVTAPQLELPANGAEFVSTDALLDWTAIESPDATYSIELALDEGFNDIVDVFTGINQTDFQTSGLDPETTYFWRVQKVSPCGSSALSEVFSFTTHSCFQFLSTDVPVNIPPSVTTVSSTIEVNGSGIITDVNVVNIAGTHFRVSDLTMRLESPQGTEIILFENICENEEDFNLGFDDAGLTGEISCPPTDGAFYIPSEVLSAFNGEDSQGTWTLSIEDSQSSAGGELQSWALELCFANGGSFLVSSDLSEYVLCEGSAVDVELEAVEVFEFSDPISLSVDNLPEGVTVNFSAPTVLPGQTVTATFSAEAIAPLGAYEVTVEGFSNGLSDEANFILNINEAIPEPAALLAPGNDEQIPVIADFSWEGSASPVAVYDLEIAFDEDFSNLYDSFNSLTATEISLNDLPPSETMYWRVLTDNGCDISTSEVWTFTTLSCALESANDLPINISPVPNTYSSEIGIELAGAVADVRITNLSGIHFRVGDLNAKLISPSGTEVVLFANACGTDQDFNLSFSDDGASTIDCPPTSGEFYAPLESLSAFTGEEAQGTWTLELEDSETSGGGSFENWNLEICYVEDVFSTDNPNLFDLNIFPNPAFNEVTIDLGQVSNIDVVQVLDISGRLTDVAIPVNQNRVVFNISQLASGMYFIRAIGPAGQSTYKFMKE